MNVKQIQAELAALKSEMLAIGLTPSVVVLTLREDTATMVLHGYRSPGTDTKNEVKIITAQGPRTALRKAREWVAKQEPGQ